MDMPDAVRAYFDADRRNDPDALAAAFLPDAVVQDEGASHEGVPAIRSWWVAAKGRFDHVTSPIKAAAAGDQVSVQASVSGDFPNSPAILDFFFTTKDGRIAALEIN